MILKTIRINKNIMKLWRCSTNKKISQTIRQFNPTKVKPYNIPDQLLKNCDRRLLHQESHPLAILKQQIQKYLPKQFNVFDNMSPVVSVSQNFQVLNITTDHASRQSTDTFYINNDYLLRTHTSAHQVQFLSKGINSYVLFGDVYRRDQIDRYHYPVFHQMEAVRVIGKKGEVTVEDAAKDLKKHVEMIVRGLFGQCQMRWADTYFPFTDPSFELQIFFDGKWVEMLGSGVLHWKVMERAGRQNEIAWAAGLGLERFAMRLFDIPDVRLFWSEDIRFKNQFKKGQITQFKEFSKYPACFKDLSMWVNQTYNPNNLYSIIRDVAGDLVQNMEQSDTYEDKKTGRKSKTYRICFRSLSKTLTNEQIDKIQFQIRKKIQESLKEVELR